MNRKCNYKSLLSLCCVSLTMWSCILQISSEVITGIAIRRSHFDNKIQDVRMLWQRKKRKTSLCIGECVRDQSCASVFYNDVTGICQGHSITFGHPSLATDYHGFRYYVRTHGEKYIGDYCVSNDNCSTVNSECRSEMCQCKPGYSFSPRTHECMDCGFYGNDFWEIPDHFIDKTNMEVLYNMTRDECFEECRTRTNYACVTLEYGRTSMKCYLSNASALDYPDKWYEDIDLKFNVSHYQRDCA